MKNIHLLFSVLISACGKQSNLEMNLQESETFLEQNLLNSNVIQVEPGLQYIILESSQASVPSPKLYRYNHGRLSWNVNGWFSFLELCRIR